MGADAFFKKFPQLAPLKGINPIPEGGERIDGSCVEATTQAKLFLVDGKLPKVVNESDPNNNGISLRSVEGYETINLKQVHEDANDLLVNNLRNLEDGFYVVDADDHDYGLLKHEDSIYMVDASDGIYKEIDSPDDFVITPQDHDAIDMNRAEQLVTGEYNMYEEYDCCLVKYQEKVQSHLLTGGLDEQKGSDDTVKVKMDLDEKSTPSQGL